MGGRATNEMKVGHITQDTVGGAAAFFDEDVNWIAGDTSAGIIDLGGRSQFDIGSGNAHPDYSAGPATAHGSSLEDNYTWDNTFTLVQSGWGGDHTFKAGAGYFLGQAAPKITGSQLRGVVSVPHERAVRSGESPGPTRRSSRSGWALSIRSRKTTGGMGSCRIAGRSTGSR